MRLVQIAMMKILLFDGCLMVGYLLQSYSNSPPISALPMCHLYITDGHFQVAVLTQKYGRVELRPSQCSLLKTNVQ